MPSTNHAATHRSSRRSLAWSLVPAFALLAGTIAVMAGFSGQPPSNAATTTSQTVLINGSVTASLSFSPVCNSGAITFAANFTSGGSGQTTNSTPCAVTFDTNNGLGAKVEVLDNDGVAPFFCTGTCTGADGFANVTTSPSPPPKALSAGADNFGAALLSTSGSGAVQAWSANAAPTTGSSVWYPIDAASSAYSEACRNNAATAGTTCNFTFGGVPKSPQNAGSYTGTVKFLATAL